MRFGADVPSSSPPTSCPPTPVVDPASIGLKFVVENVRVVHRHAVDDEQRLDVAVDRAKSANRDLRSRARIARRLRDCDVRRLTGERLHDVRFVRLDDQLGRHAVADVAELLDFGRRAGTCHDDFTELKRIRLEHEVLRDRAWIDRDARALRLVADAPRGDRDGLTVDACARHRDRERAVVTRDSARAQARGSTRRHR